MADITRLIDIIQKLVSKGNTVIVIEHNLDVALQSDWILDIGPDGGSNGGEIIAQGTPEQVASVSKSCTAKFLRDFVSPDSSPFLTPQDIHIHVEADSTKSKRVVSSSDDKWNSAASKLKLKKTSKRAAVVSSESESDDFESDALSSSSEEEEQEDAPVRRRSGRLISNKRRKKT
jgi:excinuclease ABC subunit A